jgi:DNA-binding GntR family transcriptional regulator
VRNARPRLGHVPGTLPLARQPLSAQATARLRDLIRAERLTPGTHLVEADLASLMGVSRGPVREALRNLEREGLVVISPDKGAMVTEWNLQDLLDLYDVRGTLEVRAIALATERDAVGCVAALDELLARWEVAARAGDRAACADLDFDWHRIVWRHALNRFLQNLLEQTIQPIQTVFYLNATRYDDVLDVVTLHRHMRDAVATGQHAVAHAAMEAHMRNSLAKARKHSEQFLHEQ